MVKYTGFRNQSLLNASFVGFRELLTLIDFIYSSKIGLLNENWLHSS